VKTFTSSATLKMTLALLCALPVSAWADRRTDCVSCHGKDEHVSKFESSVHRSVECTACHEIDRLHLLSADAGVGAPQGCVATFKETNCATCHQAQAKEYKNSVHDSHRLPIACEKCHQDIHEIQSIKRNKAAAAKLCSNCHERQQGYFESIHYKAIEKGSNADGPYPNATCRECHDLSKPVFTNVKEHRSLPELESGKVSCSSAGCHGVAHAPSCGDCHGVHGIQKVDNDAQGREFHTLTCLKCHDTHGQAATPVAGETYFTSFHGKNVRLGYPERVAGCADCHTAHDVRNHDDPKSSIHSANLVATCRQCHPDTTESFTKFLAHGDDMDVKKFPVLYWTRIAMTSLLVGTFLFFWIHSILWALRAFVDRHERMKAGHVPHHDKANAGKTKTYRRFTTLDIILHIMVIVSFLALSVTGLPLKFNATSWGKILMDLMGGTERARAIHHAAAIITFTYFAIAIGMSLRFLFSKNTPAKGGLFKRLLGPDSLFPRMRDAKDMLAMFKWFFYRGPRPTFDRWAYWEKFDFLAVFWGMFAIGLSGLMLWFPEWFATFVPGWAFNLATIVHSDEALLATGFIFTVHFFNTHFRPEKMPMDTVIFNGRVSEEEMMEERGDQLKRYEAEGAPADLLIETPRNVLWEFAFRIFGLVAVVIGLGLAVLMFTTLLSGGH